MKLYFAYGSNMLKTQMRERCPQSRKAGVAQLPDWRWIIDANGFANVVPEAGAFVKGVLYEIGYDDEAALDLFEEVAAGTHGKRSLPMLFNGRTLIALCYVNSATTEGVAKPDYGQRLLSAFADAGFDKDYLEKNVSRFLPARAA